MSTGRDSGAPLREALRSLIERLEKEKLRSGPPQATERVGGAAKIGQELDRFLRRAFALMCSEDRADAEAELKRSGARAGSLRRATAGDLEIAYVKYAKAIQPRRAELLLLYRELSLGERSRVHRVLKFRNDAIHEEILPGAQAAVASLAVLARELLRVSEGR